MSKTILFIAAPMLLLVGCTNPPSLVVGTDHPANPDAAESPLPSTSRTLAVSDVSTQPQMEMRGPQPATTQASSVIYVCPMHPEVTSTQLGKCPKCAMNLVKKEVRR